MNRERIEEYIMNAMRRARNERFRTGTHMANSQMAREAKLFALQLHDEINGEN